MEMLSWYFPTSRCAQDTLETAESKRGGIKWRKQGFISRLQVLLYKESALPLGKLLGVLPVLHPC